jgi:hypothetical protein
VTIALMILALILEADDGPKQPFHLLMEALCVAAFSSPRPGV